jgi:hypothetical protein
LKVSQSTYLPFLQFIGTQRSGSNLLRVMLNQLPEISAPHPPHVLKTFYPLLPYYGDLTVTGKFFQLVSDVCHWVKLNPVPWEGVDLDPRVVHRACSKNTLLEIFIRIHEMKTVADHASISCCKSMESIWYADELEKSGVQPVYIHIYRDGRDVALSFLKAIVGQKHIYFLAKKWAEEQALSLQLKTRVGLKRFISVRYEDLIKNPSNEMQRICNELNLRYDEGVLNYFLSKESINTSSAGLMWRNVAKPIMSNNVNKFSQELSLEEIEIFETVAGSILHELGYPLYTSAKQKSFTIKEIEEFKMIEEINSQKMISNADKEDLRRREGHQNFLSEIMSRKDLIML